MDQFLLTRSHASLFHSYASVASPVLQQIIFELLPALCIVMVFFLGFLQETELSPGALSFLYVTAGSKPQAYPFQALFC
jgi:hypothetical protein